MFFGITGKKMARAALFVTAGMAFLAGTARADEVVFTNGDKLTGKIGVLDSDKLTFKSVIAGDIIVDMKNVKTFSSDGPIDIRLKDGTVIHQKVTEATPGSVAIVAGGSLQPQQVPLANVKKINGEGVKWTGDVTIGGLITKGNSDSESFSAAAEAVRRTDLDRLTLDGQYLYGKQKDKTTDVTSTTTDNWSLEAKYDYFFTEKKFYGYLDAQVAKDRIAFLDLRFVPGVGVGYQWVEKPNLNFFTEAGVGWFYEDYTNDGINQQGTLRFAYHFDWKLNDKVELIHNLEYYPKLDSVSDYFVTTDAGIRTTLTKTMFSEVKVQYNHDNRPAPGAEKDDFRLLFNLGWTFQ